MKPSEYLDALLSLPGMSSPIVSWDGKWVAWTWFRAGPTADVYVAPTDGSKPPTRLTDTLDNTFLVSWTPDNRAILVEQDKDGNERAQLFRVDLTRPIVMTALTESEPNYFIRGGDLHPNGRWLVYGANFDVETVQEIEPTWIYRHDLRTGERLPLARPEKGGYIIPELSPIGTPTPIIPYFCAQRHSISAFPQARSSCFIPGCKRQISPNSINCSSVNGFRIR